ncbi:hypothetical protein Q3G72_025069 [Acer saccharum]|nr:hypothetical protein Q3G72_025069 [Acer saccharum]
MKVSGNLQRSYFREQRRRPFTNSNVNLGISDEVLVSKPALVEEQEFEKSKAKKVVMVDALMTDGVKQMETWEPGNLANIMEINVEAINAINTSKPLDEGEPGPSVKVSRTVEDNAEVEAQSRSLFDLVVDKVLEGLLGCKPAMTLSPIVGPTRSTKLDHFDPIKGKQRGGFVGEGEESNKKKGKVSAKGSISKVEKNEEQCLESNTVGLVT